MAANHHHHQRFHAVLLFVFLIFTSHFCEEIVAMRILGGEKWMIKNLVIQSLPRGPVPPSGSNPCTYIPGGAPRGRCTLAGDFSDHAAAAPPAFPAVTFRFGAVYESDGESRQQDSSS
ncbi:hypothetical protein C2S52_019383 [Perilla frutescens var. hirtella]|nr:hypothetical protein C2S52_019383 [Perilla frutescens var. hirtella]